MGQVDSEDTEDVIFGMPGTGSTQSDSSITNGDSEEHPGTTKVVGWTEQKERLGWRFVEEEDVVVGRHVSADHGGSKISFILLCQWLGPRAPATWDALESGTLSALQSSWLLERF